MPWKPSEPGEVPTLGYQIIDWISDNLAAPDKADYEPFVLYREQEDFVLRFYALDPNGEYVWNRGLGYGRRRIQRALLGRPRGWGKSPLLAALAIAEALGPVVPAGWDADGQPVGQPWSRIRTPLVHIAAVSDAQTANTWTPLLEMLEGPVVDEYPGLEPLGGFVNLPRGKIEPITSSARTVKGARAVFAVLDQTEEWVPSNGGPDLAKKMRTNAAKVGGSTIESPNAFIPGDASVAEDSAAYAQSIVEGRALNNGLLYDHREAPPETDMFERESVTAGLRVAYGDSSGHPDGCVLHDPPCEPGHFDIDSAIAKMWESDADVQESKSDFLNQITHAATSWMDQPTWAGRYHERLDEPIPGISDGDVITLGFDGSRGRFKGKPDATALIGCRVSDGHVFEVDVWEADGNKDKWPTWTPPIAEIEAAIARCFSRYRIAAFYCDPAKDWRSYVNAWEARFGAKLVKTPDGKHVQATRDHPFEWWMTGGRSGLIQRAIEQLEGAIRNGDMTHDGSSAL
ncbi:MAG: hypothetical protein JWO67_767, partial [Streptosporangiaceae bacterium]|nr:hypothetical protein [Streptosporangiaceae bacterium]